MIPQSGPRRPSAHPLANPSRHGLSKASKIIKYEAFLKKRKTRKGIK
jgi:hypothetical protein